MQVFPNPSEGEVNITFAGDEARIDVATILGQQVSTHIAIDGSTSLFSTKGFYLLTNYHC